MSRFTKIASIAVLAASLAPFAAHARSGDIGTTGPATHASQSSQHGAFVPGRGAENRNFNQAANSSNQFAINYVNGRPVSNV